MGWFGNSRPVIEALVEAHYVALYRYAFRLSGSAQEAEDLTPGDFLSGPDQAASAARPGASEVVAVYDPAERLLAQGAVQQDRETGFPGRVGELPDQVRLVRQRLTQERGAKTPRHSRVSRRSQYRITGVRNASASPQGLLQLLANRGPAPVPVTDRASSPTPSRETCFSILLDRTCASRRSAGS